MARFSASLVAAVAACSLQAGPGPGGQSAARLQEGEGPDAGVDASVDAPMDSASDAPSDVPVVCGTLCGAGDRLEATLIETSEPWTTYRQDTVEQTLEVDSAGGSIEVTLRLTGNFGTAGMADGVTVAIGDSPPCPSSPRVVGQPGVSECRAVVPVAPGHTAIPVVLHQWNGAQEGWAVISETVALVLQ